jgi:hypothetical protein
MAELHVCHLAERTGKLEDIARGDTRICSQRIFETIPQYVERDAQRFHIS